VTEADLDAVVGRVLQQKFAAGLFDAAPTDPAGASILDSPPHRQLAREAATQGIVLLKNDGSTLPMSLAGKTVAVFGELGQDTDAIVGTYVLSGAAVSPPRPAPRLESEPATC
jgi:beta-glucosidase